VDNSHQEKSGNGGPVLVLTEETPRVRIQDITVVEATVREDLLVEQELEDYERAAKREEVRSLQLDNRQRLIFADRVFYLLVSWLIGLFGVLFCQGFALDMFQLPENVLLALIGGTTLNVIGIFMVVVRYVFPKR
jgi:hypothetical protein